MSNITPSGDTVFSDLGLSPKLLKVLDQLKFTRPTPIQRQAIPAAAAGKDVIGIAQTGTGKTLAFSLPMLQQIAASKKQGLIILPTRELAAQVDESLKQLGRSLGLRTVVLIGGSGMGRQINEIRRHPHVIIGTPGRINDHLERKTINLSNVGVLVLDEADRMLDMGFAPQIKRILQHVPAIRQTLLFSATMPPEIANIASSHMRKPVRIEASRAGTVARKIEQKMFIIRREQKGQLLNKLLSEYTGTVLVFSRTKYGAKKVCRAVRDMGHSAAEIHSNLSLSQRRKSMEGFKSGRFRVLVATDIAARGIDVTNIELVVNYDLPDNPDDYVHRVGRTGRADAKGQAVSFITPDQRGKIYLIERLVRQPLRIAPLPELPAPLPRPAADDNRFSRRPSSDRQNFRFERSGRNQPNSWRRSKHKSGRKVRVHR